MSPHAPAQPADDAPEVVDAVVVSEPRALAQRRTTGQIVKTQAVVVAGSFAVGAATAVVVAHRRSRRPVARGKSRRGRNGAPDVAATRSFLVDIHLLNRQS